jgi:hypothetical protein
MRNFIVVGVLTLLMFITGCSLFGGDDPMVLTESTNVSPESIENQLAVTVAVGELSEDVRAFFEGRGATVVLTTQSQLLNVPGAIVIQLDQSVQENLLREGVVEGVLNVAGSTIPGLAPFLPLLGLFSRRVRRILGHTGKSMKNGFVRQAAVDAGLLIPRLIGLADSTPTSKAAAEAESRGLDITLAVGDTNGETS